MPDPLSPETLARIRALHSPFTDEHGLDYCEAGCHDYYPCDAAVLLAELERVQGLLGSLFGLEIAEVQSRIMPPSEWDALKGRLVLDLRSPQTLAQIARRLARHPRRLEIQRWLDQRQIDEAGITVTGGWAGPSALRPSVDVDHCHCGPEGLEPAHPRHDG